MTAQAVDAFTQCVEINPKELAQAIKAVSPHISKDARFPRLQAVLFRLELDGTITLTATDRHTIGRSTVQTDGADCAEQQMLVSLADVKMLAAWLPTQKLSAIPMEWQAQEAAVEPFTHTLRFPYSNLEVRVWNEDFPRTQYLFAGPWGGQLGEIRFDGDLLARFTRNIVARNSREKQLPVVLSFGSDPTRPVKVTFSNHFTGLIQPMRGGE